MDATELRIGNLVDFNGEIAKISQLLELEVVFVCGDYEFLSNLKPIQLTAEWLLKFGFEETEFVFRLDTFFLTKSKQGERFLYQAHQNRFCILHVHQLQNLYFALYKDELVLEK